MAEAESDLERLIRLIQGFRSTQTTYVFARLGLADHLDRSPGTADELALKAGVNAEALGRVLRLAAYYGLVAEIPGHRFELTSLGGFLRADVKGSERATAIMLGQQHYAAWAELLYSVETGEPAFEHLFAAPFFDYMAAHPVMQTEFDAAMSAGSDVFRASLVDSFDFSRARVIVDVGGGNGSLTAMVLKHHPAMQGVVYDQPQVLRAADQYLIDVGVRDRCRLEPGSFFESVPAGGDVYLLGNIVHDWDDEKSTRILRNCRASMSSTSVMLLVEAVMPEHGQPSYAAMMDVNMLVLLTGRERTERDFRSLLASAGLRLDRVAPLSSEESLLEARPV